MKYVPGLDYRKGRKFQCSLSSTSEPWGKTDYSISRNMISNRKAWVILTHIQFLKWPVRRKRLDIKKKTNIMKYQHIYANDFWIYLIRVPETPLVNRREPCNTLPAHQIESRLSACLSLARAKYLMFHKVFLCLWWSINAYRIAPKKPNWFDQLTCKNLIIINHIAFESMWLDKSNYKSWSIWI